MGVGHVVGETSLEALEFGGELGLDGPSGISDVLSLTCVWVGGRGCAAVAVRVCGVCVCVGVLFVCGSASPRVFVFGYLTSLE